MKLLQSGLANYTIMNDIQVAVAPIDSPPFPVEAMVFEEDANLILTVDPIIEYEAEHIIRTMTNIMISKKHKPGSVVVNGNSWYAVVIDLEQEPLCRKEWCDDALDQVFQLAEQNKMSSIALPVLGTVHGGLQVELQLQCLMKRIVATNLNALKRLWIVAPLENIWRARGVVNSFPNGSGAFSRSIKLSSR